MFFVFANWKMALSLPDVRKFFDDWRDILTVDADFRHRVTTAVHVSILPSFPFLPLAELALIGTQTTFGAQDCSHAASGAHTGDVSASVIRAFGGRYVLVGHSERRRYQGDGATLMAQKMTLIYDNAMTPIYCIGESLEDRHENRTLSVLGDQLDDLTAAFGRVLPPDCLIAYEPLWAIGTGLVPSPDDIKIVHNFLKNRLPNNPILYGGSVTSANSAVISAIPGVDGLLVGGASTTARSLADIIRNCCV